MKKRYLCLPLLLIAVPAHGEDHVKRWFYVADELRATFGIPMTDERDLTLYCERGSKAISVAAYVGGNLKAGRPVSVTFDVFRGTETLKGRIEEGESMQFVVLAPPDGALIRSLLADGPVAIEFAGEKWTVPGNGASAPISSLTQDCASVARRAR